MKLRDATLAAHAGIPEPRSEIAPHTQPLYQTSVYDFPSIDSSLPALAGKGGYVYGRNGLPNSDALARAVAALEGAEAGVATSSGMAAVTAVTLALCSAGDRAVIQSDAYGGTPAVFRRDFERLGIETVCVDAYDVQAVAAALPGAKLLLVESISNPLLRRVDLAALSVHCRDAGTALLVDNTFATPLGCRPLEHGADGVLHSATKFLGGHHDLLAGAFVGPRALVEATRGVITRMGLHASPMNAWLAVRGIRTLEVRMRRAWENAAELAKRLAADPRVSTVYSTENCALVSFDVGSYDAAERMVASLSLITFSPSLGGVTTTLSHCATSSHRALSDKERGALGIGPGMLRLSVGVENIEDLWNDLSRAG